VSWIVGVDPGPTPGVAALLIDGGLIHARILTQDLDVSGLCDLLDEGLSDVDVLAVERFIISPLAARGNAPRAGRATRDMVAALAAWADDRGVRYLERSAAEVKPWATDARLNAVGLLDATKGVPHARDAARHALYAAVKGFWMRDPLSKRGGAL